MKTIEVPAYAKINLGLEIVGKRPDGYHNLCTIYQQIDLADTLRFTLTNTSGTVELICSEESIPSDGRNLVVRAARLLASGAGRRLPGVKVELVKRIPVGGGLGGGSSDAAVTLVVLNELWSLGLSTDDLAGLARQLGADVPFFLLGGTALGTGIGDKIMSVDMWENPVGVLLVPDVQVSTAWAYSRVKIALTKNGGCPKFRSFLSLRPPLSEWAGWMRNDFEPIVFASFPQMVVLRGILEEAGAKLARMTGSGACLFGLFPEESSARDAVRRAARRVRALTFRFARWGSEEIREAVRSQIEAQDGT